MNDEEIIYGQFVTRKVTRPATKSVCTESVEFSSEDWRFGRFVTLKNTRPTTEAVMNTPSLRVTVSALPNVPIEQFSASVERLGEALGELYSNANLFHAGVLQHFADLLALGNLKGKISIDADQT